MHLCDKVLDVVEPLDVLLLLLVVNVVGDEQCETGVDATLLKVLLKEDLEVLVEVAERRALLQVRSVVYYMQGFHIQCRERVLTSPSQRWQGRLGQRTGSSRGPR